MKLRLLTLLAIAMIAFYAGVWVDAARTTDHEISIPEVMPPIQQVPPGGVRVVDTTYAVAESDSNPLFTAAAIGAIAAALFLLARLGVIVVRRVRAARQA
jgi:hypothetical protein